MPGLQSAVGYPTSSILNMQPHCPEFPWSPTTAPSHGLDQLFQSDSNSNQGLHGNMVDFPVRAQYNQQSPGDASRTSFSSSDRKRGPSQLEFDPDHLPPSTKTRRVQEYRNLFPKPTASSLEAVVEGIDDDHQETQHLKKIGKRKGPLEPEGRQGASKMRELRACAACFISKTRVSSEKT